MKQVLLSLLILYTIPCYAQKKGLINAIRENAYPLNTTNPQDNLEDLSFLKELIRDKSVIALGDATHGTKEFFTMKHRLVRYLVEKAGYRIFVIEANLPECMRINDYVMYGKGNPEEALYNIYFWIWNTDEIMEMIQWMRNYNEGKEDKDKVRFYGNDMRFTIAAADFIMKDLDSLQIDYSNYKDLLDSLSNPRLRGLYRVEKSETNEKYTQVLKLCKYSEIYKSEFINKSDAEYYKLHQQYLNVLVQAMVNLTPENGYFRDSCMAANTKWISEYEQTDKIIVWAHSGHISKTKSFSGATGYQMGYWLSKLFPEKYYAIGFDFHDGSFRAYQNWPPVTESDNKSTLNGPITCTIKKPAKNSSHYIYHKTGLSMFYLDHKTASANKHIQTYLNEIIRLRLVGALFKPEHEESYYYTVILNKYFDATLFINTTTPTILTDYYTTMREKVRDLQND